MLNISVVFVKAGIVRGSLPLSGDGIDIHEVAFPLLPELYPDLLPTKTLVGGVTIWMGRAV